MSLLNDLFNEDNEIILLNKKYLIIIIIVILLIILFLVIKIDNIYHNSFDFTNGKTVILVEKEYINKVKETNKIEIEGIMCGYSINEIMPFNDNFLIDVKLNTSMRNINNGTYKVYLGKERIIDYIIRIIKK